MKQHLPSLLLTVAIIILLSFIAPANIDIIKSWGQAKISAESKQISPEQYHEAIAVGFIKGVANSWLAYLSFFILFIGAAAYTKSLTNNVYLKLVMGVFALLVFSIGTYTYLMSDEMLEYVSDAARRKIVGELLIQKLAAAILAIFGGGLCYEMLTTALKKQTAGGD